MILPVFSVYDSKLKHFSAPHIQQNTQMAIRAFAEAASEPGSPIFNYPSDFSLVQVGTFNEETGVIAPCDHENLGPAAQYKRGA